MDLRNSLLVLAIERLEDISLDELATKINTAFPDKLGSLRKEEVDQAFEEWQRKDAEENPANRRRYLMAQAEIQYLFEQTKSGEFVTLETTSRPQESPGQHMHKSRTALLQKPPVQSPLGDITNKERESEIGWGERQTGSNVIPLGQRSAPSASSKREIIEIEDDEEEQLHTLSIHSRVNPSAHRSEATDALLDSDADEMRTGRYTREDTPVSQGAGECNIRGRKAATSRNPDNRSSAKAEHRNEPRSKRNEGRLSYDDDVFIDSQGALQTPKAKTATKQHASGQTDSKDEAAKDTESEAVITPEGPKKAEEEAEKFLQVLKLEIGTVDTAVKDAKSGIASDQAEARVPAHGGADDNLGIHEDACQGDDGDASAAEDDPTLFQAPDGIQYRLVRESRFRPEVVALFKRRENPIVHSMANRRSARQVWEEADRKNAT
ncbi:hypothetical protein DL768_011515 [Monosporascus sp. mg162]|nr:hypothetical protein DL768_011515 [Monosporascus sp. mg162]